MSAEPGTGTLPTDAELVILLRKRLSRVEHAVLDYLDVIECTSRERKVAWDDYESARTPSELFGGNGRFLTAYRRTQPERDAAGQALVEALRSDWRTAILTAVDMTDENRVKWLTEAAAETNADSLIVTTSGSE